MAAAATEPGAGERGRTRGTCGGVGGRFRPPGPQCPARVTAPGAPPGPLNFASTWGLHFKIAYVSLGPGAAWPLGVLTWGTQWALGLCKASETVGNLGGFVEFTHSVRFCPLPCQRLRTSAFAGIQVFLV